MSNVQRIARQAANDLRLAHNVRRYPVARKCPRCGRNNFLRRPEGTCFACVACEVETHRYGEKDPAEDVLQYDSTIKAAIAELPPRKEPKQRECMPREYATDLRGGMAYMREVTG